VLSASIFISTHFGTSVNIYQTTRRNNPADGHI
jgi:hypothetical protein